MMTFEPLYWHWLTLGLLLAGLEIFIPSFTVIWFGLGAILVGLLTWLLPGLSITLQLLVWTGASITFAVGWFAFFKPRMVDHTRAGLSREAVLGEVGQVIELPLDHRRGKVRFSKPLLGADEWAFICEEKVQCGDRVIVLDVSGNTLIVKRKT
ncbi:MAG TPA: NfeD family protein [Pseudomonadales bacterium]|nr:NfeD family protein [Pseudomonadales bacterium]HMU89274.1 NfeD family protein [Pseudomonadales bacterium]HMW82228.1 NfeD family protein [Pseudomonadales bacterium]HMY96057.1 NfeD family protein [Pseudomonadales bacterium]HND26153.1 NfeD family protein [Pseudomonadales bacterium]